MKDQQLRIIITVTYVLFLIVSFLLPFYSFEGYSILRNTTSHLGAQGSPNAWLMNTVFIILGLVAILRTYPTGVLFTRVLGFLFGLSLILTGVFRHAALTGSVQINHPHDSLHSIFATTTGFSFAVLAVGHAIMNKGNQRYVALFMAALAIVIPLVMFNFPSLMGIFQRLMFITAFGWLFFYLKPQ